MLPLPRNPLSQATAGTWDRLVAAANPAALLVAIHAAMGERLRREVDPEDVLQETLLRAWRDRDQCEWRGIGGFRRWLLQIARNRICDLAAAMGAEKRGGGRAQCLGPTATDSGSSVAEHYAGPQVTTTPSRVATDRELAAELRKALDAVPSEWRDVVRLRLFEEQDFAAIGELLGLGVEGVRYRFRHGAEAYRRALRQRRVVGSTVGGE